MKTIEKTTAKITKIWAIAMVVTLCLTACSKDDDTPPPPEPSTEAAINSVSFTTSQNTTLYQDVTAEVNESAKTITATVTVIVPTADLNKEFSLVPNISFSNKATIEPANNVAITVGGTTNPTTYTVTAEDGTTTQTYTLTTTVKYMNQKAAEIVTASHLATLYAIKENNPNATGFVARLDLDNASTTAIKRSMFRDDRVVLNANKEITELNINASNLDVIPPEIGNLTTLTKLYAGGGNFTELPEEIGNLTNLINADFTGSELEDLPESFANLTNLELLGLNGNKLETMPEEIFSLTSLKILSYNRNSLNVLPAGIGNLTALESLSFTNNDLEGFPAEIGNLTALKTLYAGTNNLKPAGLPAEMTNMSALVDVYLLGNSKLTHMPADLLPEVSCFLKGIRDNGGTVRTDLMLSCN